MNSREGQFGVGSSLLLPLHQVGKLDSWEDFHDRQAMTLFTTRSTAHVIRCRFIFLGKNDGLTPDFFLGKNDGLTPDFP